MQQFHNVLSTLCAAQRVISPDRWTMDKSNDVDTHKNQWNGNVTGPNVIGLQAHKFADTVPTLAHGVMAVHAPPCFGILYTWQPSTRP